MTTQTPDAVREAVQQDRQAAWPFRAKCYGHRDKAGWMAGRYDHNRAIQAFVSHRLDSQPAPMAQDRREAVARIVNPHAWPDEDQIASYPDADWDAAKSAALATADAILAALDSRAGDAVPAGEVNLPEAARLALMYLETGHVECPQCGHEVPTKDLDAVWQIKDGLAALSHGEGRK